MEIPYTVTAREDTGLWNAKLGIWLFLASEVMLFGGLFSGYIFLRLGAGADPMYHWPTQELKILPGFINTLVLIASSVTVVMAWVSLKLRKWKSYQMYMGITLLCAAAFMCIKAYEYNGKFHHTSVRLTDETVVDGHVHKDVIHFEGITEVALPTSNPSIEFLSDWAYEDHGHAAHGDEEGHAAPHPEGKAGHGGAGAEVAKASGPLEFLDAEGKPIASLKRHFETFQLLDESERPGSIELKLSQPQTLGVDPGRILTYDKESITLRNGAVIKGHLVDDAMHITIDAIDLRNLKEPGEAAVWDFAPSLKEDFMAHADGQIAHFTEEYPELDPLAQPESIKKAFFQHLEKEEHVDIVIPREQLKFYSTHTPKWNTYYAIYFTMTGLHGLHVIGGALVLGYFLFRGRELYDKNPEHLANRVEVGGLFWHFVDLVWIFLFPIMYLL